jgi:hypothetical protein
LRVELDLALALALDLNLDLDGVARVDQASLTPSPSP